ncbi:aspartate kinase [Alicyclobacillus curvatus]|nr:aspartate kinase [Alicyclobacillus curvatus]
MRTCVQKYGGTSLAAPESRLSALRHVEAALNEGFGVVVVVSAMGRKGSPYATDTLLDILDDKDTATKRDLDMLLSCGETISSVVFASLLRSHGHDVTVFTGKQAGIITNDTFGEARIVEVNPGPVVEALEQGKIVIVMGFQGATPDGELTTLGRGGSDITASALGVALKAAYVDIFTDVPGIMTADPRIVPDARPLRHVTYYEICNLAYQGAKVIHPRAVEMAMQNNIPIQVRSTFSDDKGTQITTNVAILECSVLTDRMVTSLTQTTGVSQVQIPGPVDVTRVFSVMADHKISVEMMSVLSSYITFTVANADTRRAVDILSTIGYEPKVTENCAKISIIGESMAGIPGIMAVVVSALAHEGIEILQTADSHTTIWCLVKQEHMGAAIRAIHRAFHLETCQ